MSHSSWILVHGPALSVKPYSAADCRKQTRKVVCCCPWSSRDATKPNLSLNPGSASMKLPPSPSILHLAGIAHYFLRSFPLHHPLSDLAMKCGPLMHVKIGETSIVVVSSAHHAEQVLKIHDLACANRPKTMATQILGYNNSNILFSPYGEYWKLMRQVCNLEMLSPKSVRSSEWIRKDEASDLIQSIQSNSGVALDLTAKISLFMYSTTSRAVWGRTSIPIAVAMIKAIKEKMILAGRILPGDMFPSITVFNLLSFHKVKMMMLRMEADKVADDIIEEHRKTRNGNGDLVDAMLRLQETAEVPITNDNIKAVILDIIIGGTETSASTVDWAMAELMKNPRVMAKAQDEIRQAFNGRKTIVESEIRTLKYLKLVIKETLRLHPPVSLIPRSCREAFEIDGYHIPLNAYIFVNIWQIGRDPEYWSNPESFEPERFEEKSIDFCGDFGYIPFGSGKRICPGMTIGLASVEFLLAQLLYYFDWKLPQGISPNDIDMTEVEGVAVSRKSSLYLIATPHVVR